MTVAVSAAARAAASRTTPAFLFVVLQFALLVYLLGRFNLEGRALQDVAHIALAGFLVHHFLPQRWRLPFFLCLSLAATAYVLGLEQRQWRLGLSLARALPLFAIGVTLIALCHLPLRAGAKVALLLATAGGLAWARARWGDWTGDPVWIWPVLGSMFMFRLMLYLYEVQNQPGPLQPVRALSYFFLLPNVCFPLFPVIDYRTFCRNYFNEAELRIYQRGLGWITRGIVHLLLWRVIYYEFHVDPSRVASGADLITYIVSNVGLYLRVSGQFHLAVGLLLLFGFNLPETNHRYFLAASFMDYWRRVNIYWKDFIMKLFYYPAVFRLKAWGVTWSMVAATVYAFAATWFLHAYQTFWVRDTFPVNARDVIFWSCLCLLLIYGSLREMHKSRKPAPRQAGVPWAANLALGARTAGTFAVLTTLWSLWGCSSVEQWLGLWELADADTLLGAAATLGVVFVAALAFEGNWRSTPAAPRAAAAAPAAAFWRRAVLTCTLPALLLLALSVQRLHEPLGPSAVTFLSSLYETKPNKSDEENLVRGYYEDLQEANPMLEWVGGAQPKHWDMLEKTPVFRPVDDYRMFELAPSQAVVLNGHPHSTNRWGMRDRDYELRKRPGTFRMALLGSSVVMGLNVDDGAGFEALVEERLNRERAGRPHAAYEVLNFAVNAYTPPTQVVVLEKRVLDFRPDALLLVMHPEDSYRSVERFAKSLRKGIAPMDEVFGELAREAGVSASTPELRAVKRLMPHWPRLVGWAYHRIAERCREHGIRPVLVYLPGLVGSQVRQKEADVMIALARDAGFAIVSLEGVYGNAAPESLRVAPWDAHANAQGHRLIADKLYAALTAEGSPLFAKERN